MNIELKSWHVALIIIMVFACGMLVGVVGGEAMGKHKMATMCNIMEKNAGCNFACYDDGCLCEKKED